MGTSQIEVSRLLKIDPSECQFLDPEDACYYLFEYITGELKPYSPGNQLIFNFKKSVSRKTNPSEWQYKTNAIKEVIGYLVGQLQKIRDPDNTLLIPIPPSKARDHEEYDDRLVQVLEGVRKIARVDYRDILSTCKSTDAAHFSDETRTPDRYMENIIVDPHESLNGKKLVLFDDVITTGAHFKACQTLLQGLYPDARIVGLFLGKARSAARSDY